MPMNLDAVGAVSQPGRNSWTSKDALLYALGVGAGQTDPTGFELEFTTENSQNVAQRVLPTMPVVIAMGGGPGLPSWGDFDFRMLLHGEQGVTVHGPIPPDGEVESVTRIVGIYDKGKAAVVRLETECDVRRQRQARVRRRASPRSSAARAASARSRGDRDRRPAEDARPQGRPRGDVRDADRPGVALPAQRRPQPVALRPGDRQVRGLRQADPARALHVRLHRPRAAARAVRLRRRQVQEHGRALLEAGHARATRSP